MADNRPLPAPTIEEQAAFYDEWNLTNRSVSLDKLEEESQARAAKILELASHIPGTNLNILEIGCGTGWLTEPLSKFGRCTGIDLSEKAIGVARERGIGAEFLAGDFFTMALPTGQYDIAVVVETIAYVQDQPLFVSKLVSHLKPDAHLILTTVNKFVYERRSDIGPPKPGQIRRWLSMSELRQLLQGKFRILESTTVLPQGNVGLLRIVNSHKLNRIMSKIFSANRVRRWKEWLGFGHTRVILAQLR